MRIKTRRPFKNFEVYEHQREQVVQELLAEFFRRHPNHTYAQYAELAGIGRSTLENLTHGRTRFPRLDTIWKLARAVGYLVEVVRR